MNLRFGVRVIAAVATTALFTLLSVSNGGFIRALEPIAASAAVSAPDWAKNAVIYEVNTRQFTPEGTFDAMSAHLPRLKELGVDVLWFMPIHPIGYADRKGSLGSPYSISDYKAVNPELGSEQDFKDLVNQAHSLGMKVLLDWVANHTAWDHPWLKAHPDWYTQANGKIIWPAGTDWTDVADLNYDSPSLRAAMIDALSYWVSEFGVDGYRADVAGAVPTEFWQAAISQVNTIKPLFWLAEDGDNTSLLNAGFQANYNWQLLRTFNQNSNGRATKWAFTEGIPRIQNWYPLGTYPMNFITNHDENSWSGTEYDRLGSFVKTFAAISFTLPGMPLLYSGQEVGNRKMLAFFEKDQINWDGDTATTNFYKKLIKLKHQTPALNAGSTGGQTNLVSTSSSQVVAYSRIKGSSKIFVVFNTSSKPQKTTVKFGKQAGKYFDFKTAKSVQLSKSQALTIPSSGFKIFSSKVVK